MYFFCVKKKPENPKTWKPKNPHIVCNGPKWLNLKKMESQLHFKNLQNKDLFYGEICTKLMRSNRGHAKIRSKSYSNWLLIDFCDSIPAVWSIVATISIRIRTQISNLTSNLYRKSSILPKIGRIWSQKLKMTTKINNFRSNLTNFR